MALDFGALEAAVGAWLAAATGLPAADNLGTGAVARIIPRNEKVPQPPLPYLDFLIPLPNMVGGQDEIRKTYDAGRPLGQEVRIATIGQREFVCSVRCFTRATVGGQDGDGYLTARAYIMKALAALALPSVAAALSAAGLAFVAVEGAQDFSARLGPVGQGRAVLDARFRCIDGAEEGTGYIETVGPLGEPDWSDH